MPPCENQFSYQLTGDFKGYRKYRVGDYRIIYRVEYERLIVYIIAAEHRGDVYR